MKTLLICRHAKSSWDNSYLGDHERPLNKRGKAAAPKMGQHLKAEDVVPDLIISSTAKRAIETAKAIIIASEFEGELQVTRDFYLADPEAYYDILCTVSDEFNCVMVVGHNPGMEELVDELTDVSTRFTTANIAHIELPISAWKDITGDVAGVLKNLWRPKEI
ncbi:MAG: histidine phosphatase family protein [Chloroflexi bacterium]|nr:histidine phosphatase family protein [Chloroflexota bacterium]